MGHGDSEYLKYLTGEYMTILHDLQHESSVDDGNDPSHALLSSSLMKDEFDYMFEANEGTRLAKPLRFTSNKPASETKKYLGSLAKSLQIESQIDDDSDHGMFLDNIKYESADVIYQSKNGVPKEYKGIGFPNYQADDNATSKKCQSKHAIHVGTSSNSEDSNNICGNPQRKMCSNFRVKIMEILSKPYDKEEHERLLYRVTEAKPQYKHRDLRSGGVKFYPSDKMGKSLLDHHLVLKRKIKATAKDDLKQLNLLRGFFFWLQIKKLAKDNQVRNKEYVDKLKHWGVDTNYSF